MDTSAVTEDMILTLRNTDPVINNPLLLIAAFPKSGAKYTAKVLQQAGLDINHEVLRVDGTVSWWHILFQDEIKYQHIFHQVRHPLDAISSSQELPDSFIDYIARYVFIPEPENENPIIRRSYAWLGWNQMIEAKAEFRFRAPELEAALPEIASRVGRILNPASARRGRDHGQCGGHYQREGRCGPLVQQCRLYAAADPKPGGDGIAVNLQTLAKADRGL